MKKQQKQAAIDSLETQFSHSQGSFLINYQGMSVAQFQKLRFELVDKGGSLKVAKNRLARIALKDISKCQGLEALLKGQLAYVFSQGEVTSVAKVLVDFAKNNENLKVVAGCSESKIYDAKSVQALALLPSREVLLSQLCGVLKAPSTSLVLVLNQLIVRLLLVLKAVEEQKSKQNS